MVVLISSSSTSKFRRGVVSHVRGRPWVVSEGGVAPTRVAIYYYYYFTTFKISTSSSNLLLQSAKSGVCSLGGLRHNVHAHRLQYTPYSSGASHQQAAASFPAAGAGGGFALGMTRIEGRIHRTQHPAPAGCLRTPFPTHHRSVLVIPLSGTWAQHPRELHQGVARGENERVHHHGYSVAAHLEEEGGPSRPVSTGPRKERRRKVLLTRIGCRRLLHHQVGLVRAGR